MTARAAQALGLGCAGTAGGTGAGGAGGGRGGAGTPGCVVDMLLVLSFTDAVLSGGAWAGASCELGSADKTLAIYPCTYIYHTYNKK